MKVIMIKTRTIIALKKHLKWRNNNGDNNDKNHNNNSNNDNNIDIIMRI